MSIDPNDPQYQAYSDGKRPPRPPIVQSLTIQAYTLAGAIVIFGIALSFIGAGKPTETTPMIIGVIVGLIATGLIQLVGYKVAPLPAGAQPDPSKTLTAYRSGMTVRFALAEVPALAAFAATIAFDGNVVSYLPGGLISLALMAVHVLPNRAQVARVEQRLDADGARSGLSSLFGY